jgi:hypothetical protein
MLTIGGRSAKISKTVNVILTSAISAKLMSVETSSEISFHSISSESVVLHASLTDIWEKCD